MVSCMNKPTLTRGDMELVVPPSFFVFRIAFTISFNLGPNKVGVGGGDTDLSLSLSPCLSVKKHSNQQKEKIQ